MTSVAIQNECKYGKNCPFGVVCKFRHDQTKTRSKPNKAKAAVTAHVAKVSKGKSLGKEKKVEKITPHVMSKGLDVLSLARTHYALSETKKKVLADKQTFEKTWIMADAKGAPATDPFGDRLKLLDNEMAAIRGVLSSSMKEQNYEVWLSGLYLFASTVTTGVVNTVNTITAASYTDFTALAGLFEEFKITEFKMDIVPGVVGGSASTTPANTGQLVGAIVYSVNQAALTSATQAIDDGFSKLLCLPVIDSSGRPLILANNKPIHFACKIPAGVAAVTTAQSLAGEWVLTSDTTTNFGYIKTYWVAATATATANALAGTILTRFHFRNRV